MNVRFSRILFAVAEGNNQDVHFEFAASFTILRSMKDERFK